MRFNWCEYILSPRSGDHSSDKKAGPAIWLASGKRLPVRFRSGGLDLPILRTSSGSLAIFVAILRASKI
jgi:hypothetical protein